jgi:hypothetical protein
VRRSDDLILGLFVFRHSSRSANLRPHFKPRDVLPSNRQIIAAADLPPPGTSRERLDVDFKERIDPSNPFELGKDLAAFANASGGVVLVGAKETNNHLDRYTPLSEIDATETREAFAKAARDRCHPPPVVDPVVLPQGAGHVVAVNVLPFPGQPVGVWVECDKKKDGFGGRAYVFPVRVGIHTVFFRPEQLPMLIATDVRRVVSLLEGIPLRAQCVALVWPDATHPHWSCMVDQLNVNENSITVVSDANQVLALPVDSIRSVWKDPHQGVWKIAVAGTPKSLGQSKWGFVPA